MKTVDAASTLNLHANARFMHIHIPVYIVSNIYVWGSREVESSTKAERME